MGRVSGRRVNGPMKPSKTDITSIKAPKELSRDMELWIDLKDSNAKNQEEIKSLMRATGYSQGEVASLFGSKAKEENNRLDQIKEDIYIRHRLRMKMLHQNVRETNILSTMDSMRQEEQHLIEALTKLGEISPVQSNTMTGMLGLETLIYKVVETEKQVLPLEPLPSLPVAEDDEE